MKNKRNYYRILHIQPDAPKEIVQASYRTLMQKLRAHPDLGGEEWNATVINEAYRVLMDSERREDYDANLFRTESRSSLGKQHHHQRQSSPGPTDENGWRPFQPRVIEAE